MPKRERFPALRSQVRNRILLALPEQEFQNIYRHLAFVELRQGKVLYNADNWIDYAYFMNNGMTSSVSVTAEGETVEDGTVGHDGLMGGPAALGEDKIFCSGTVQIPGSAMRIGAQVLKSEFQQNAGFSRLLQNYVYGLRLQLGRSDDCHNSHSLEQRLCRLMLMSQDCTRSGSFPFTFEFLSHIVRATREDVSSAIGDMHEAGLIYRHRGSIRIVNREEVERRACRCGRLSARNYDHPASSGKAGTVPIHQVVSSAARHPRGLSSARTGFLGNDSSGTR
jgi:CRP-like cAMP-binding protein